jgi:hypothetical protein
LQTIVALILLAVENLIEGCLALKLAPKATTLDLVCLAGWFRAGDPASPPPPPPQAWRSDLCYTATEKRELLIRVVHPQLLAVGCE